jgi:hypothetical protein
MRLKSWFWISALAFLIGSVSVVALDRAQNQGERSRSGREASHSEDRTPPQDMRGYENNRGEGEHDKEWRAYLKQRNKAYKEQAKANREEQKDFDKYRREREKDMREDARDREKDRRESVREADRHYGESVRERERDQWEDQREREWREYLKERNRAYKDYSRTSRQEQDDFYHYRRDRGYQTRDEYGSWGSGYEPRNGACFYMDSNYNGERFCINSDERQSYVGSRYNDRISSIRFFGRARRIVVYEHENYGGSSRTYTGDVPGLGNFNDKISSFEVR